MFNFGASAVSSAATRQRPLPAGGVHGELGSLPSMPLQTKAGKHEIRMLDDTLMK